MTHISGTKWNYEEAKEFLESKGFILVDNEFVDSISKMVICDIEGYYYYRSLTDIINGYPQKICKSNPYTIQNIHLWCKLNNKPFDLLSTEFINARTNLKWQCFNENCGEIFEATWDNIYHNHGCGVCNGKQVTLSNCLATKNPELAKEWHPTLNGDLIPYNVTPSSNKEVWWQCLDKPDHIWKTKINNRNIRGDKCPYCSGKLPSKDYNLLVVNPELCEEWDYNKNKKKLEEYLPYGQDKVYWECKECGHSWKASIRDRNKRKTGCPQCSQSKGEKECKRVFINVNFIEIIQEDYNKLSDKKKYINTYFIPQKTFNGLIGLGYGLLSYDFYIPKLNLLIEYQGEQHERYIPGFHKAKKDFEKQLEHDKRKRKYALKHNINLLEIWYYDFDNIEEILDNYIRDSSNGFISNKLAI